MLLVAASYQRAGGHSGLVNSSLGRLFEAKRGRGCRDKALALAGQKNGALWDVDALRPCALAPRGVCVVQRKDYARSKGVFLAVEPR